MAFADHLTQERDRRKSGQPSLVAEALLAMPTAEADAARILLANRTLPNAEVAEVFTGEGFPMGEGAVRNWRIANKVGRYAPVPES